MNKLRDIFEKINNGTLLLPDFQRDYKWGAEKQRNLLASLLLKFPVGSTLILNGKSTDFAARKIGELKQSDIEHEFECEYLLDGQQRTTTLYNAFNNTYCVHELVSNIGELSKDTKSQAKETLKEEVSKKANSLKFRWFLKLPDGTSLTNEISDIFGAKKLTFEPSVIDNYEPEDITGIIKEHKFSEKNLMSTKWFSPFYELDFLHSGKSQKQFATDFVNNCVSEGLIPLFLIGESSDPTKSRIITRVLEKIAQKNSQVIKDELDDDIELLEQYDFDGVLEEYDSIEDVVAAGNDFSVLVDNIFNALEKKWVSEVHDYLVKELYNEYELLSIETNDIRRAIPIFCHLNEGGMKLDDFDLLAARAAKKIDGDEEAYSLSHVVRNVMRDKLKLCSPLQHETLSSGLLDLSNFDSMEDGLPTSYIKSAILSVCSLLAYGKQEQFFDSPTKELTKDKAKSKALLSLSTTQIRDNIETAVIAVLRAFAFLAIRCGVYGSKKLHYTLMIQPIAFAFTQEKYWEDSRSLNKIEHWYWSSLFSGAYLYDQSSVVIQDLNNLMRWLETDEESELKSRELAILKHPDYSSKELLLMRGSEAPKEAIRSAILQFILSQNPFDLTSDKMSKIKSFAICDETKDVKLLAQNSLHDHHIIPVDIAKKLGENSEAVRSNITHILNSPLNRLLISAEANLKIGSLDPARYFALLGENGLNSKEILRSNAIPESFVEVNTDKCSEADILPIIEERFELLSTKLKTHLLRLLVS